MNLKTTSAIIYTANVLLLTYGSGLRQARQAVLAVNTPLDSSGGLSRFMEKGKGTEHFGQT